MSEVPLQDHRKALGIDEVPMEDHHKAPGIGPLTLHVQSEIADKNIKFEPFKIAQGRSALVQILVPRFSANSFLVGRKIRNVVQLGHDNANFGSAH